MMKLKRLVTSLVLSSVMLFSLAVFAKTTETDTTGNKLVFAATMIRHGNRTPYFYLNDDLKIWGLPEGYLLPQGMHKELELGRKMRRFLVMDEKLLPSQYNPNDVYVLSDDCPRVLLSANCFLFGLYPPGTGPVLPDGKPAMPYKYQPIPINAAPETINTIISENKVKSAEFNQLLDKYSYTQPQWLELNKKYEKDFAKWGKIFGIKISNLGDALPYLDNMGVREMYGKPLPEGISKEEAKDVFRLNLTATALRYQPKELGVFMAGPFYKDLVQHIKENISGKSSIRYTLYSAHDTNLLGAMSALGKPLDGKTYPPYAAYINYLVYDNGGKYSVEVTYMGKKVATYTLDEFYSMVDKM